MAFRKRTAKSKNAMQTAFMRFMLVVAFFIFWIGAVSVRLVHLQVNEHGKWKQKAIDQRERQVKSKSLRGTIYDRNGNALAMSIRVESLYATPGLIADIDELSRRLGKIINRKPGEIADAINKAKDNRRQFVWLARELSDEKVKEIREKIFSDGKKGTKSISTGLHWLTEQMREYPHGTLAAHVIGFSNADDIGQAGIERSQEEFLKAEIFKTLKTRDSRGRVFSEVEIEKTPAKDVVITISKEIQHIAEQALARGIARSKAVSGKAIVMDPKTGEILAMANYPTFDPSKFRKLKKGIWRNNSIQDQYAPGSVFKLITYGAALEEGLISPENEVECGEGSITVGGYTFNDSHSVGTVSYTKALAESSNVGAIKTGIRIGRDKYYRYARDFGFGAKTGIGLPSEAKGVLRTPDKLRSIDLASMSIGYGVDVTALQTAVAFATIANDGVMVKPRIVKNIQQDGQNIESFEPTSKRIVKSETAQALKKMLQKVVSDGTAKLARLDGYTSAGKTGTAWKYDRDKGAINKQKYVSSFVGFAPANNPAVVIAVIVDEPKGGRRDGGHVAAPVFREIAGSILPKLNVPSDGIFREDFPEPSEKRTLLPATVAKVDKEKQRKNESSDKRKAIEKRRAKKEKPSKKPSPKPVTANVHKWLARPRSVKKNKRT